MWRKIIVRKRVRKQQEIISQGLSVSETVHQEVLQKNKVLLEENKAHQIKNEAIKLHTSRLIIDEDKMKEKAKAARVELEAINKDIKDLEFTHKTKQAWIDNLQEEYTASKKDTDKRKEEQENTIKTRFDTAQSSIALLNKSISTLTKEEKKLQSDIDSLKTIIKKRNDDIDNQDSEYKKLEKLDKVIKQEIASGLERQDKINASIEKATWQQLKSTAELKKTKVELSEVNTSLVAANKELVHAKEKTLTLIGKEEKLKIKAQKITDLYEKAGLEVKL